MMCEICIMQCKHIAHQNNSHYYQFNQSKINYALTCLCACLLHICKLFDLML